MSTPLFKVLQIDHIGIAVSDPAPIGLFLQLLGIPSIGSETVQDQRVHTTMFDLNDTHFELLQATQVDSPIAKFIDKRGTGVHHLAIRVDHLPNALAYLASNGIQLIDTTPRRGAGGKLIAFLHPKSTGGILVELSQLETVSTNSAPVKELE